MECKDTSKIDILKHSLLQIVENIDAGNSNAEDSQIDVLLDTINKATNAQNKMSKYQACKYLNISRATFDNWVRDGKLPKGKKEQGFKELFWEFGDLQAVENNET